MDFKDFIDVESGLARCRSNKDLYLKMLKLFIGSGEFNAFEEAISVNDNQEALMQIHAIKGLSGNLSMPALFKTSSTLNEQLKMGNFDPETLSEYRDAYIKTRQYAEQMIDNPGSV